MERDVAELMLSLDAALAQIEDLSRSVREMGRCVRLALASSMPPTKKELIGLVRPFLEQLCGQAPKGYVERAAVILQGQDVGLSAQQVGEVLDWLEKMNETYPKGGPGTVALLR